MKDMDVVGASDCVSSELLYPLSSAQEGIWLDQIAHPASTHYIAGPAVAIDGPFDVAVFEQATKHVANLYDALRIILHERSGVVRQSILPFADVTLTLVDYSAVDDGDSRALSYLHQVFNKPFELYGNLLWDAHLVRVGPTRHYWLQRYHHLITDGVSIVRLFNAVIDCYSRLLRGDPLPTEGGHSYLEFLAEERAYLESKRHARDLDFWCNRFAEIPPPLINQTDFKHPPGIAECDQVVWPVERSVFRQITAFSTEQGLSVTHFFLALICAYFARTGAVKEMVIGLSLHNRGAARQKSTMGPIAAVIPIVIAIDQSQSFADLMRTIGTELRRCFRYRKAPLADINRRLKLAQYGRRQLFDVTFSLENFWEEPVWDRGVKAHFTPLRRESTQAPLGIYVHEWQAWRDVIVEFDFDVRAIGRDTIERMRDRMALIVNTAINGADLAIDELPLMSEGERNQVIKFSEGAHFAYAQDDLLHQLFEAQVERSPQAIAVMDGREQLTYAQLNERANQLAHYLSRQGVNPDQFVALLMERSVDLVVGVLGVLKAGGAYIPIDPSYPPQRVQRMLADAMPRAVITQERLCGKLPEISEPIIAIDAQRSILAQQAASNLDPRTMRLTPRSLAYVLYTSGSTGIPKGVMVEHRNIVNYSLYAAQRFDVANGSGSLICTSLNFDLTLTSFYPPLISGRALRLCAEGQDLEELSRALLDSRNLAPLKLTPSHLLALQQALPTEDIAGRVRTLVLGGEPIANHAVQYWMRHAPQTRVFNHYGPTEATVGCAVYEIEGEPSGTVPIGRPIANAKIYILDERRRPVAIGVAGEIYIGGAGVARGYLNRPQLTEERFVADQFSSDPEARMYRTGDVGRWRPDGNIEFLGRNDQQVKIRGFRIELGEIEARLAEHAGVGEVAVVAREEREGEKRLVAYYTSADAGLSVEELRAHVKASLPEYMAPSAYIRMERLPLTANGKLDRKALPAPDTAALQMQRYEAPRGEIEVALASIWQELLHVERVGRLDNFFELGGHSLLAVQLLTRIRSVLRRELALRDLFEDPILQSVAKSLSGRAAVTLQPIEQADRARALPLSYAQQRLWFVDQLEGAGPAYHIAGALKLRGRLDKRALQSALDTIVERHEALRTVFAQVEGNPIQVIAATAKFALRYIDLSIGLEAARNEALKRHIAQEVSDRFDLSAGPLIRARLIRLGDQEHVLVITMHHIVSDGWSIGILIEELRTLYTAYREGRANSLPQLPIQYADYAVWQRQWLQGEGVQAQLNYWKAQLADAPALLELPTDRPRPLAQDFRGGSVAVALDSGLTDELNAFSRDHDVTWFMTLYAGFAILLSRLSGQKDIVIGSPLANRQSMEVEPLIGFFVNTLPLRIRLDDDPSASEILQRVKEMTLAAYSHQDIPFEQIVEEIQPPRSLNHSPVYQVSLTWGNTPQSELALPGLTLTRMEAPHDASQIDLSLILREEGGRIVGNVNYAGSLFDRATIERWMRHFTTALVGMLQDAERPVTDIPLLSEQERHHLIRQFNATEVPYRKDTLIHELFEEHVGRDPAAVAGTFEGRRLTYGELNRQANQLAHYLREQGARPDTLVAICIDRGVEMMVGLLGILKAGAAYVPLDPSYPEERLAYILEDTRAPILLTSESIEQTLPVTSAYVIAIDSQWAEIAERKDTNLHRAATGVMPESLAYVIYTSGSTGRPKGVMVEHRNLANLVHWHCMAFDARAGQRSTTVAGFGFDAAVWEMWTALCAGAELVLPSPGLTTDVEKLLDWWEQQQIDVSFLPTPMAEFAFNRGIDNSHLRILLVGGDQLLHRPDRSKKYQLINNYGLTETTVVATSGYIEASEKTAHIGRPISNTQIYILDAHHHPVPVGVVGELYVGGASVARGYLNRPELTAERFVRDPFSSDPQARMYKTGDLGRWRADGNIEFVGRNDQQVKIRGYRIELGEIESRLSSHEQVKEAVVVVREKVPGEKHLVAYVTYAGKPPSAEDIRAYLKFSLPSHMIPAAFVPLEALPLTPNGKVDRQALPAPDWDAFAVKQYEPPQGEIEEALADIWQELLRIDRVGRHDNFFDLGGHSLLAVQAIAHIRQKLEVEISLAMIFDSPSVAALAEMVVSAQLTQFDPADIARISAELATSPAT